MVNASAPASPNRVNMVWRSEWTMNPSGNFSLTRTRACWCATDVGDIGLSCASLGNTHWQNDASPRAY